jgi:hypothetical protein
MSSADYYRIEAERCHKLAETSEDPEATRRWRALAGEYNALADEIERVPSLPAPKMPIGLAALW